MAIYCEPGGSLGGDPLRFLDTGTHFPKDDSFPKGLKGMKEVGRIRAIRTSLKTGL